MSSSLLAHVELAPRDPILGLSESFAADTNPAKVNLGAGVYYDDGGKIPLLECVKRAERALTDAAPARGYLPIDGIVAYDREVMQLVFGADSAVIKEGRAVTVQALGGTGGLKIGADFLRRLLPASEVWISDPSWENHRALFESAGFVVKNYPYFDAKTRGLNFSGMLAGLNALPAGAIVVLHIICHNPTGADLTTDQWTQVMEVVKARDLVPFLDMAYQGFAESVTADGATVRRFAELGLPVFVSSSFSKSFSLYGERVGALSVVTTSKDEADRVLSHLKRVVRTNYSSPPTHGGQIVATILANAELRAQWDGELATMRERIKHMRRELRAKLEARVNGRDFTYITAQRGMFSYTGLSKDQVARLRTEYSVYAVDSGRICVACLNTRNIDYVADAIAAVSA